VIAQEGNTDAQTQAKAVAAELGVTPSQYASGTKLDASASGNKVLFLGVHVRFNLPAPLFSTISFKSDNDPDGQLEVRTVYGLNLAQGLQTVILSGSQPSPGTSGAEIRVLSRAFLDAGTPRLVMSLWNAPETGPALLSGYLAARMSAASDAAALRTAMLRVRADHPEPYYWANFILSGLP
jgi:CHAT domain-containing protein